MLKYYSRYIVLMILFLPGISSGTDGKVAYLAHTQGYWQVWVMQPDGSNKRQITDTDYDKSHISWYPDGMYLLVNGNQGELEKIGVDGRSRKTIRLLTNGISTYDASISPDGKRIVFSLSANQAKETNHIWIAEEDSGKLTKMTNMTGLQHEPVWSPDGESIYFLFGKSQQEHDIWRLSLQGKTTEQLTAGQLYNFDLAVSKNNALAYSSNRSGNYEIWIRRDGKEYQLTHHNALDARPTWSRNEAELIFESARDGKTNIWHSHIKGDSDPMQLTKHKIGARYPVWWQGDQE